MWRSLFGLRHFLSEYDPVGSQWLTDQLQLTEKTKQTTRFQEKTGRF